MKKLIALFMGLMMIISLTACSNHDAPSSSTSGSSAPEKTQASGSESAPASEPSSEVSRESGDQKGKTLVVYFSATGNTESAANYIAEATGGDLFELEPADPYTDEDLNYGNKDSRVSQEHDNEDLRNVKLVANTAENWAEYDTVFIGYPIWWGIAAWPVDDFVKSNDFTEKTVIPFATSASSGLGESGELLAEMAGTGDWQEGQRFRSSVSQKDVQEWVEGLGL